MTKLEASARLRLVFATAEVLAELAGGEGLEFWTHDERQALAALSRGLTVRGVELRD